jgi:hypothetical protein
MTVVETQFIQHPKNIPLRYCISDTPVEYQHRHTPMSCHSGLRFHSHDYIEPQQWLHLSIPLNGDYFETDALVCWCKPIKSATGHIEHYVIGVSFGNHSAAFSARMAEQVCHIEAYKKTVEENEGRELSNDQAASEWIAKHADHFPPMIN